jgi:hypothetical protein
MRLEPRKLYMHVQFVSQKLAQKVLLAWFETEFDMTTIDHESTVIDDFGFVQSKIERKKLNNNNSGPFTIFQSSP